VRMPLAVVTTKPLVFAEPIVAAVGLSQYFTGVFGPTLDARAETKTETLGRALAVCGSPGQNWMVGDRSHDMVAGKAHGARTVGVTWGIGDETELTTAGADHIVAAPQQLPYMMLGAGNRRRA
ncbi:MAG: HAD hydrolase-like protein, partial [Nitriliruptorales bacterium]|nr:HAD hydrolase-like protein [Nitriliruptorales bacterium]